MDIAAAHEAINGTGETAGREWRVVQPGELPQFWPLVRRGVEEVCERGSDGWLVEDVYMAVRQGVSLLCVATIANYYVGFVVVTPTLGWHRPQLHIWCAYNRGERDVLDTFLPDVIALAKARGAAKITMSSPRKGWERRAAQLGFHPTLQHYAMEI